ncbi:MAG: ribosome biogenesis GTP-binding protein YihA/YsxC [Bacillota bacterium]
MHVKQAELKIGAYHVKDFPSDGRDEIAFLGRSNVGKSSLINVLIGRKNLARTSSTPGKTRGIYFYLINDAFYFVDLPGYGYARVSKSMQQGWTPLIEDYLGERQSLRGCIHLIDSRQGPTADDLQMTRWLRFHQVVTISTVTKADKLSRGALLQRMKQMRVEMELSESDPLLPFSARTGAGRDLLWKAINNLLR